MKTNVGKHNWNVFLKKCGCQRHNLNGTEAENGRVCNRLFGYLEITKLIFTWVWVTDELHRYLEETKHLYLEITR